MIIFDLLLPLCMQQHVQTFVFNFNLMNQAQKNARIRSTITIKKMYGFIKQSNNYEAYTLL